MNSIQGTTLKFLGHWHILKQSSIGIFTNEAGMLLKALNFDLVAKDVTSTGNYNSFGS